MLPGDSLTAIICLRSASTDQNENVYLLLGEQSIVICMVCLPIARRAVYCNMHGNMHVICMVWMIISII